MTEEEIKTIKKEGKKSLQAAEKLVQHAFDLLSQKIEPEKPHSPEQDWHEWGARDFLGYIHKDKLSFMLTDLDEIISGIDPEDPESYFSPV